MHRLCTAALALLIAAAGLRADDWPQWMGRDRDGVWHETGILDTFPKDGPKVLWRTKVAWGYAGPAVADGLVYVNDFESGDNVMAAMQPFPPKKALVGKERLLCLDAKTGKEVWKHEYDLSTKVSYPGPRCTPTVAGGKVYSLGSDGHLVCLDAKKGSVLWSKDFAKEFGGKTGIWGYCGHPLVDGKKLFCVVGGKDGVAMAFDKDTGEVLWKALEAKEPGYCPPTMITAGGTKQLLIWHATAVNGLDPETGKVYWTSELEPSYGMSIAAPQKLGDQLFAGGYGKSLVLELAKDKPEVKEVWRGGGRTGLGPINATPLLADGTIYGVDRPGPMRAVDLQTGKWLWSTTVPVVGKEVKQEVGSGTAFLVKNGDRHFIFAETGHLIIAKLSREGYKEIDRWKMLVPTNAAFGRPVVWSHPAFADKCVFARNDKEIVCVSLAR